MSLTADGHALCHRYGKRNRRDHNTVGDLPQRVAATSYKEEIYVVNQGLGDVSVIDTNIYTVTGISDVGDEPAGVATTPNDDKFLSPIPLLTVSALSMAKHILSRKLSMSAGVHTRLGIFLPQYQVGEHPGGGGCACRMDGQNRTLSRRFDQTFVWLWRWWEGQVATQKSGRKFP
jgi:YVTN family beta-propeller protein